MDFLAHLVVALTTLAAPGAGSGARQAETAQQVDLIEVNHFIDREGREVFRQVLFYDWSPEHRQYIVRAWRLVKSESILPRRKFSPLRYECLWHDDGVLRRVTAPSMRETWTQHDPERTNRQVVSEEDRIPLDPPAVKKPLEP